MSSSRASSAQIRSTWERLSALPMGKWLFSQGIGRMAPYTGTIGAVVDDLVEKYIFGRGYRILTLIMRLGTQMRSNIFQFSGKKLWNILKKYYLCDSRR